MILYDNLEDAVEQAIYDEDAENFCAQKYIENGKVKWAAYPRFYKDHPAIGFFTGLENLGIAHAQEKLLYDKDKENIATWLINELTSSIESNWDDRNTINLDL